MELRHQTLMHDTNHPPKPQDDPSPMFRPPVETPATILEARLEDAGRRVSTYLRHLPLPERKRHELALATLSRLAENPGANAAQAEARGMRILHELLDKEALSLFVVPAPPLSRSHMKPEEMDRRPWVRVFARLWRPVWSAAATIFNTSLIDFFLYALLLAGLYLLGTILS
jgi:hypothetical protein